MLEKGNRDGKLTQRGKEVLDILHEVYEGSKGRLGELSDIGAVQHQGIARRMFHNFPQVFQDGAPCGLRAVLHQPLRPPWQPLAHPREEIHTPHRNAGEGKP